VDLGWALEHYTSFIQRTEIMKQIVCVWELGADLGHMMGFFPLAKALQDQGHKVTFILRDLSRAQKHLGRYGFDLLQAPIWLPPARRAPNPPASYAEILHHCGFLSAPGLLGMVRAWRRLFDLLQPDLILFDHAPTALLAARGLPLARAGIGTGFTLPPQQEPLPPFMPNAQGLRQRIKAGEQSALVTANRVLKALGQPEMEALCNLWDLDERFLCALPSLDHYPEREGEPYWGCLSTESPGVEPRWTHTAGAKVFAYLKPQYPRFEPMLAALAQTECDVLVFSPDVSQSLVNRYQSDSLVFSRTPFCMDRVMSQCDLVVCHSGFGTLAKAAASAKPLLLAPIHREQAMIARNIANRGVGLVLRNKARPQDIAYNLRVLLDDKSFTRAAQQYARQVAMEQPQNALDAIIERCQQLVE